MDKQTYRRTTHRANNTLQHSYNASKSSYRLKNFKICRKFPAQISQLTTQSKRKQEHAKPSVRINSKLQSNVQIYCLANSINKQLEIKSTVKIQADRSNYKLLSD